MRCKYCNKKVEYSEGAKVWYHVKNYQLYCFPAKAWPKEKRAK